jgi:hypothetical protein
LLKALPNVALISVVVKTFSHAAKDFLFAIASIRSPLLESCLHVPTISN